MSNPALLPALAGTGFTFLLTALGAATVFFFRGEIRPGVQRGFLGFAAGVMVAASVWSLLIPAMDMAAEQGKAPWLPAAGGFLLGALFFIALDSLLPHLHPFSKEPEGMRSSWSRTVMLILAVTLHNIPEGLAVGLSFGLAALSGEPGAMAAAATLALGMGLQNFPEGAAISLPLRQEGLSRGKAFFYGALSGLAEPVAGVAAVLLIGVIAPAMPWLLSFAAGAMIYVVVEELVPATQADTHSHAGTAGFLGGFVLMMVLDVALG